MIYTQTNGKCYVHVKTFMIAGRQGLFYWKCILQHPSFYITIGILHQVASWWPFFHWIFLQCTMSIEYFQPLAIGTVKLCRSCMHSSCFVILNYWEEIPCHQKYLLNTDLLMPLFTLFCLFFKSPIHHSKMCLIQTHEITLATIAYMLDLWCPTGNNRHEQYRHFY